MRCAKMLIALLAGGLLTVPTGFAQSSRSVPDYLVLKKDAGPWLICVQTFVGSEAYPMAARFANYIMDKHKIRAYLYDSSSAERKKEADRIAVMRDEYNKNMAPLKAQGVEVEPFHFPKKNFPDSYAVFIVPQGMILANVDQAHEFLVDKVRKLPPPGKEFSLRSLTGERDGDSAVARSLDYVNPFQTAFAAPNVLIPVQKISADDRVDTKLLYELNEDEPYSVLSCSKAYTLMVKEYQGAVKIVGGEVNPLARRGNTKDGEVLSWSRAQARQVVQMLRTLKIDAYILHTEHSSIICVGNYNSPDDPKLKADQRTLANFKWKGAEPTSATLEDSLSSNPLPMKIPRR